MSNYWNYQKAQIKKIRKVFPMILGMSLVLLLGVCLLGYVFTNANSDNNSEMKKFQVGVVGDTSDKYLSMGISAAQSMDSSRYMVDFLFLSEEEAIPMIKSGELSAYLVIPDGFVKSVMKGENLRIQFVSSEGTVDITTILLNEVAEIVSKMITESQAAGAALYDVMVENGLKEEYKTYSNAMDLTYGMLILTRTDTYDLETYKGPEQISTMSYYVCGILLFFLLIWGINAASILAEKNIALQKLLKSRGQRVFMQVLSEYLAYFLLLLASMLCIFTVVYFMMEKTGMGLAEWDYAENTIVFRFFIRLVPVFCVVAAIQFFLYECTRDCISGVLLQFIVAISLAYISGCFYPVNFFPELIGKLDQYLPTGIALQYMCDAVMENKIAASGWKLFGWTFLFIIMASLVRNGRLNQVNKGN